MESKRIECKYLYHKRSGFIYAVMINDGIVLIAAGPLSYNQATALNLDVWPFGYKAELEERINEHREDYEVYRLEE